MHNRLTVALLIPVLVFVAGAGRSAAQFAPFQPAAPFPPPPAAPFQPAPAAPFQPAPAAAPPSADVLVDRALASGDEHAIKLTEAALRSFARSGNAVLLLAAADACDRL